MDELRIHLKKYSDLKPSEQYPEKKKTSIPVRKHRSSETEEIIRNEINLEKHAEFIFIPSHSPKVKLPRKKMWTMPMDNGDPMAAYLLIESGYKNRTPSTKTRKILLALAKFWYERADADGNVTFSSRELAETIGIKWAGKRVAKELYEELRILRSSMLTWKLSFESRAGVRENMLDHITILDKFTYYSREERIESWEQFQSLNVVKFSEPIQKNLEAKKTKPTNFTTILSIQGEIALVLYARLDIILADKSAYERRSKELFDDMHLGDVREYKYPSGRKRTLDRAIQELNGKAISTGRLRLSVQKTVDQKDWKLVARKLSLPSGFSKNMGATGKPSHANSPDVASFLAQEIGDVVGRYEEKRRLYERFATSYPSHLTYRALSEFKAESAEVRHSTKFFTAIMHRLAHEANRDWIKPCGPDCRFRKRGQEDS